MTRWRDALLRTMHDFSPAAPAFSVEQGDFEMTNDATIRVLLAA
jgi:hypothetical protein